MYLSARKSKINMHFKITSLYLINYVRQRVNTNFFRIIFIVIRLTNYISIFIMLMKAKFTTKRNLYLARWISTCTIQMWFIYSVKIFGCNFHSLFHKSQLLSAILSNIRKEKCILYKVTTKKWMSVLNIFQKGLCHSFFFQYVVIGRWHNIDTECFQIIYHI
jgi:hypothetical protein